MSDRLTLLQKEGESYEKHEETPTISFIGANENLTLPYIHLQWMRRDLNGGQIQLQIDAFRIILQGHRLHALWRDLQLYRVRQIHESDDHETETRHTTVRRIEIIKPDEPADVEEE
ncbi:hypothetical protein OAV21_01650 [bacterium]|jgi:hypothetical protein|nr:hypothetical protein [bacterium]MDF1787312.1 hypothetical protein [Verrucomicrobiales bacterium]